MSKTMDLELSVELSQEDTNAVQDFGNRCFRAGLERAAEIANEKANGAETFRALYEDGTYLRGTYEGAAFAAREVHQEIRAELHQPDKPSR